MIFHITYITFGYSITAWYYRNPHNWSILCGHYPRQNAFGTPGAWKHHAWNQFSSHFPWKPFVPTHTHIHIYIIIYMYIYINSICTCFFCSKSCFFFKHVFIDPIFPFHFPINFSPGLCKYLEHVLKFTEVPACELREVLGGYQNPSFYGPFMGI